MRCRYCAVRRCVHRLLLIVFAVGLVLGTVSLIGGGNGDSVEVGGNRGEGRFSRDDGLFERDTWPPRPLLDSEDLDGDPRLPKQMTGNLGEPGDLYKEKESEGGLLVQWSGSQTLFERLLPGDPPPRSVTTFNMSHPPVAALYCITTQTDPQYTVCPHASDNDRYISAQLLKDGVWEPQILNLFLTALKYYPSSTVIDLGAHVGVYTLLASTMGMHVVAVEPVWASAVRLHAGAIAGGVSGKVTLLLHAAAHHRCYAKLRYRPGNLGGTSVQEVSKQEADTLRRSRPKDTVTTVTLGDLIPYVNTSVVVLKIDIEGWECRAVLGGTGFLTAHFAPYIFMEWSVVTNNRHKYHAPCRYHHLQQLIQWLTSRGYHAYISKSGAHLNPAKIDTWRAGDIYWRHRTAPRLHLT